MAERPRGVSSFARLLTAAGLLLCVALAAAAEERRIAVVVSGVGAPYDETVAGFRAALDAQDVKVKADTFALSGDAARAEQAAKEISRRRPALVLAVGTMAAEAVLRETPDMPLVMVLVLRAEVIGKGANATGVFLEYPLETQLRWMRRVVPAARVVGVLYHPRENGRRIEEARDLARAMGLQLDAQEVLDVNEIGPALARLTNTADVLWGLADSSVLNQRTARQILYFSLKNRIPFAAPSASWVKAGALYSLDWDYRDMGAQTADMAAKVLQGTPARSLAPVPPRKMPYSLNRRTADEMSLLLSPDLVQGARTLY